jgi:hypothetical protein
MAGQEHSFRFSEREIFERGEPTSQIGLNRLTKFRFARRRFGDEKAPCPMQSPEKSNRFCPTGKSAYSSKQLGLVQNLMVMFEMNGRWREASPI